MAKVSSYIEINKEWVAAQKAKVSNLWQRAKTAFDRNKQADIKQTTEAREQQQPYLAAIIEHSKTIEQEAAYAIRNEKSYTDTFSRLVDNLKVIYKDPQTAAIKIEKTILAGQGEKLSDILSKSPEKAGALRGSDSFLNRFKAAGKERKQALEALPIATSTIREIQSFYSNAFDQHIDRIKDERERQKIEVPALSKEAMRYIKSSLANKEKSLEIPQHIQKVLKNFEQKLNSRMGNDAIYKSDFDLAKRAKQETQEVKQNSELKLAVKFVQQQKAAQQQTQMRNIQKGRSR